MNGGSADEDGKRSTADSSLPTTPTELARTVAKVMEQSGIPPILPPGYRYIRKLGDGSQGSVHLAENAQGEPVAIKIVARDDGRAEDEKDRLRSLRHGHLVGFCDWIPHTPGSPHCYLVMQYIEGKPLHLRPLADAERRIAFVQLASALAYLHSQNVTHRDVKPANVVVAGAGHALRVFLVDLGVAKNHAATAGRTKTLEFVGTPSYCAPEQLRMARGVSHAADVFSLGVCFYEALTGRLPHGTAQAPESDANPHHDIVSRQLRQIECARPPKIGLRGLPPQVDVLVRAMLHPDPVRRPKSEELPVLLQDAFNGKDLLPSVRPESWKEFQFRRLRRHRRLALGILAAVGLVFGATAWAVRSHLGESAAREETQQEKEARVAQQEEHDRKAKEARQKEVEELNEALNIVQEQRYSKASLNLQGQFIDARLKRFADLGIALPPELRQPVGRFYYERAERLYDTTDSNHGDLNKAGADIEKAIALFEELLATDQQSKAFQLDVAKALAYRARLSTRTPLQQEEDLKRVQELRLAACDQSRTEDCLRLASTAGGFADLYLKRGLLEKALEFTDDSLRWNDKAKAALELTPTLAEEVAIEREIATRRKALILHRKGQFAAALEAIKPVTAARRKRQAADSENLRTLRELLAALEVEIDARTALAKDPAQYKESEPLAREALKLVAAYRKLEPANSEPDTMQLGHVLRLATSLRGQRKFDAAIAAIDETRALRDKLRDTSTPLFHRFCAELLRLRAMCLGALNKTEEALTGFAEAESVVRAIHARFPAERDEYTLTELHGDVLYWQGHLLVQAKEGERAAEKLVLSVKLRTATWERDKQNASAQNVFVAKYMYTQALELVAVKADGEKKRMAVTDWKSALEEVVVLIDRLPSELQPGYAPHRAWASQQLKKCEVLLKPDEK